MSVEPVPACDRCDSPAEDLGLELGTVDGQTVCHECRRQEIESQTALSRQEALTATLKDFGMSHQEIADWGDISKSAVDEYSRRVNGKIERARRTLELLAVE
jgi:hypothetical protein